MLSPNLGTETRLLNPRKSLGVAMSAGEKNSHSTIPQSSLSSNKLTPLPLKASLLVIIRAMRDGICPSCLHFGSSDSFNRHPCKRCPECGFSITEQEMEQVLVMHQPQLYRSLEVFEKWRSTSTG